MSENSDDQYFLRFWTNQLPLQLGLGARRLPLYQLTFNPGQIKDKVGSPGSERGLAHQKMGRKWPLTRDRHGKRERERQKDGRVRETERWTDKRDRKMDG